MIDSDTTCEGTKYKYILTEDSYRHIYLKDKLNDRDTIVDEQPIIINDLLKEILETNLGSLKNTKSISKCGLNLTITVNGQTRSIVIDQDNPQEIACKVSTYIDSLAIEKYKLNLCDKK